MTPWSDEQRRMLATMGFAVYARAGADVPVEAGPSAVAPSIAAMPAPADRAVAGDDRLLQAVRRAAAGRDVAALVGDLEALRRDPQRKRALWPQLRALRRPH